LKERKGEKIGRKKIKNYKPVIILFLLGKMGATWRTKVRLITKKIISEKANKPRKKKKNKKKTKPKREREQINLKAFP